MSRFCKNCGKPLEEGEKCTCKLQMSFDFAEGFGKVKKFVSKLPERMGICVSSKNAMNFFESDKEIVPDCIKADDGEVGIKQYEIATLRSRIRGQWSRGRLMVTNKRILFRAAGMSYSGLISQQYEFNVNEIAGIEIKKSNRISVLNIILCILLNSVVTTIFSAMFDGLSSVSEGLAVFLAIIFSILCAVPFFIVHKKFWLKLLAMCCGIGALSGASSLEDFNIAVIFAVAMYIIWFLNVILVSLVPDLVLSVKTKGAGEAFIIRRKQFPTPYKPEVMYTGFSEVVPIKDIDVFAKEIGALIDDIQTLGDMAIDKWKDSSSEQ